MYTPSESDHETELRRQCAEQRAAIVRLAREYPAAITTDQLIEAIRQHEALERVRAHWLASDDPRDVGDPDDAENPHV